MPHTITSVQAGAVFSSPTMATRDLFPAKLKARRLWLALGWTLILLVTYLSLTPTPIEPPLEEGDKFSHILAYLVLMSWFANLYETRAQRIGFALGFIVLGVALEFFQRWTGYRSFEVTDMAASAVGVSLGWMLAPPRTPHYLRIIERVCRA